MSSKSLVNIYLGRWMAAASVWNEARHAAKYDDSLFIWIPKNAGTSVSTMLRQNGMVRFGSPGGIRLCFRDSGRVTFGHQSIGSLLEAGLVSRAFIDRAFKFAITRNPYTRAVSLYRHMIGPVMSNWREQPDFRAFLRLLADDFYDRVGPYTYRGLSPCNPQVEWLRDTWPDKLYSFERLDEFLDDISERWRIPKTGLQHLKRSDATIAANISREEKSLIERIYAEDFDVLGYSRR